MSADGKHDAKPGVDPHEADHVKHYTKIYFQLLGLFGISVLGPVIGGLVGSKALVLVTAFGIALIKAYLVCAHFMHLNIERRYIGYLLTTTVVFMLLFYAGVSPDVRNWASLPAGMTPPASAINLCLTMISMV